MDYIRIVVYGILPVLAYGRNSADLYHDLFDNYTPVLPVTHWEETVYVSLAFALYQLKSLDGKTQTLETTGQLVITWHDHSLSWDPYDYDGQILVQVDARKIWTPVIGLRNSAGKVVDPDWLTFPCLVLASGIVVWAPSGSFGSSCDLNMYRFPFDTQQCSLDFGNLIHLDAIVVLYPEEGALDLSFYVSSKEFRLADTGVENATMKFQTAIGDDTMALPDPSLSVVKFYIKLERLPAYYLLNIIVPTVVLAVLSAFNFYVPVDSGEKLSLSITILLSFSVFLLILSDNTPNISQNLPLLAVYLTVTICVSAISMIVQMLILNIYHKTPLVPVPGWLKALARCLSCVTGNQRVGSSLAVPPKQNGSDVKKLSTISGKEALVDNPGILAELQKITAGMENNMADENLREEWQIVGQALDRFCFAVFVTLQLALILAVFGVIPWL